MMNVAAPSVANFAASWRNLLVGHKHMRSDFLYPVCTVGRRLKGVTRAPWPDHVNRTVHGPHEPLVHVLDDGVPLGTSLGHVILLHILRLRDSDTALLGARGLRDDVPLGGYWSNPVLL